MNEVVEIESPVAPSGDLPDASTYAPIIGNNVYLNPEAFNFAQRVAKVFAASSLVPPSYKGSVANCIIAFNLAGRLQLDPFTLMQNSGVIHGKVGLDGKLYASLLRDPSRSPFAETFDIKITGTGDSLEATASGTHSVTGAYKEKKLSLADVKRIGWYQKNEWWKNIPDQMLGYRVSSLFCKLYCPEVALGLSTIDELMDSESLSNRKQSPLNVTPGAEDNGK